VDVQDSAAGKYFMFPNLVREDSGALDLTYYAGSGQGDKAATFRRARSTDRGKTFAPSLVLHKPITFEQGRATLAWIGDYLGLTWSAGNLFMAYTDNSSGTSHTAFYRTSVP
jgi:hypothetical protein